MIQIRHIDGSATALPQGAFVEIINESDGRVGGVWYEPQPGVVLHIPPGSHDARRYARMFSKQKVAFAPVEIELSNE